MLHDFATNAAFLMDGASSTADTVFWGTPLGTALGALLRVGAVILVIFAVIKGAASIAGGKAGKGASIIMGALALGVLAWEPGLISSLYDIVGNLFDKGVSSTKDIIDGGTGGAPTTASR